MKNSLELFICSLFRRDSDLSLKKSPKPELLLKWDLFRRDYPLSPPKSLFYPFSKSLRKRKRKAKNKRKRNNSHHGMSHVGPLGPHDVFFISLDLWMAGLTDPSRIRQSELPAFLEGYCSRPGPISQEAYPWAFTSRLVLIPEFLNSDKFRNKNFWKFPSWPGRVERPDPVGQESRPDHLDPRSWILWSGPD